MTIRLWLPFIAFASVGNAVGAESHRLSTLLTQIWQFELATQPMLATSLGVHDYDDQLADFSAQTLADNYQQHQTFMTALDAIDSTSLTRTEQINLLMQKYRLQNHIDRYRYKAHYVPITSEYGFHSRLASLPRTAKFRSEQDYRHYLARLQQIPRYIKQNIAWMEKRHAGGHGAA